MTKQMYLFLWVLICLMPFSVTRAEANKKPFVIPELKEWKGANGDFIPGNTTRITYLEKENGSRQVAEQLAADYQTLFGKQIPVVAGKGKAGDFVLQLKADKKLGDEGYAIQIKDRVILTAPTTKGLFWATRTLLQLAEQDEQQALPKGEIRDFPDYSIRGFMLDCGRKFIPMSFLRDYVKIMSYYKMNTFQIHLNDNAFKQFFEHDWMKTYAAFRLESETFPGLAAPDGHYTKKEFIELQLLADSLGVEIIPEIDVPAHSLALTQYCPELGSQEYGMDHLDLFNPKTYEFVDALFKEYLEGENPVFRGPRVHIGTDEYSNKKKDVVEKFRAFTDHYIRYVESFGKQACVWGALTHAKGDTPVKSENVLMSAWYNGYADPAEMMKQGYQLISIPDGLLYIVPAAGYYYDYLNTERLYKEWTPVQIGKAVFEEHHPQISGGMFAVWNDHYGNGISTKDIHDRAYPAMQTLAVKMWTGKSTALPYQEFNVDRLLLSEAPGVNVAGRVGKKPACVMELPQIESGQTTELKEIGYPYSVSFEIEGAKEEPGTVLFRSADAVVYLADPITGRLGFARDGYLNTFNYYLPVGQKVKLTISGDNKHTALYVNDQLKDDLTIQKRWFNEGKDKMNYVRTLVFPLQKAGQFNSQIRQLKVYNYWVNN